MGRKSCTASWAVRGYLVSFIDITFLVEFVQYPPDCLNIIVVIGYIGVLHVYQISHFFGHILPLSYVLEYRLTAFLVKFLYAVLFYILFSSFSTSISTGSP